MDDVEEEDDHTALVVRTLQLVSLLKTSKPLAWILDLAHWPHILLPIQAQRAQTCGNDPRPTLLGNLHNGQDPRSITWHNVIEKAVALWTAQARMPWMDFTHIYLRAVFRESVTLAYGAAAATFLESPADYGVPCAPPTPPPRVTAKTRAERALQQHRSHHNV